MGWKGRSLGARLRVLQTYREAEEPSDLKGLKSASTEHLSSAAEQRCNICIAGEAQARRLRWLLHRCFCSRQRRGRKKIILRLMFVLLEQPAVGVWLSTPISAAVTFNSPIITATVEPPGLLQQPPLPQVALAHFSAAARACQLTRVTTN